LGPLPRPGPDPRVQQSSENQTGFTFNIAGFTAGADYRVRDDLLVGLATGCSHTGATFRGSGGNVQANTWPLTAYTAYLPRPFYAHRSLGYSLNLFNPERNLSFGSLNRSATSSTTGNQFNAYAETGYDLKLKALVATPVLSLAYSRLWVNGFNESGAEALNLDIPSQNAGPLQTGVRSKLAVPLKRNSGTVVPQVYAICQHEYSNSTRGLDARLSQGGNSFASPLTLPTGISRSWGPTSTSWPSKIFRSSWTTTPKWAGATTPPTPSAPPCAGSSEPPSLGGMALKIAPLQTPLSPGAPFHFRAFRQFYSAGLWPDRFCWPIAQLFDRDGQED
jgi:uncharacterized protein YhjY with autotransporter beta-barrel domain